MSLRSSPRSSTAPAGPTYIELLLSFLVGRSDVGAVTAGARLDSIEGSLGELTARWRGDRPLVPSREVRMSERTAERLFEWVESDGPPRGTVLERLAVYASGALVDPAVPDGWVRVHVQRARGGTGLS